MTNKSVVLSNFSKLLVGNVGVQIISLTFYPLLARIYSPEAFGRFGFVNSLVVLFGVFSFGQMHTGLLQLKNEDDLTELFSTCQILNFYFAFALELVFFTLFMLDYVEGIFLLVPLGVLVYGALEIHRNWSISVQKFGLQSIITNVNRLMSNSLKLFGSTPIFMFSVEIFSNFVANSLYGNHSFRRSFVIISPKKMVQVASLYREFWCFFTFYVLSQVLGSESIVIILKTYLSDAGLGAFFLGNKLFLQSALIISSILSSSFNSKLQEGAKSRLNVYEKALGSLLICLSISILLFTLDYQQMTKLLFGGDWDLLGRVLNYFIILMPLKVFSGFFAYILLCNKDLRFISIFKIIQFGLLMIFILKFPFEDLEGFLKRFIFFEFFADLVFVFWGYQRIRRARL